MEIDLPMRIAADFECTTKPKDDPQQTTLLLNETKVIGYNIEKVPNYGDLKLRKTRMH